jgi:hypothetical protein
MYIDIPRNIAKSAEAIGLVVNIECRPIVLFSFGGLSIRKHGSDLGLDFFEGLHTQAC